MTGPENKPSAGGKRAPPARILNGGDEALRTRFELRDGTPVQVVSPAEGVA